jgi:transcriptional regulator with XRE-family HTH domain
MLLFLFLAIKVSDKSPETLREVLKHRRQELGLLQPDIARAIGVKSADFISLVENGQRSIDLNRIPALARILKLNAEDLVLIGSGFSAACQGAILFRVSEETFLLD